MSFNDWLKIDFQNIYSPLFIVLHELSFLKGKPPSNPEKPVLKTVLN